MGTPHHNPHNIARKNERDIKKYLGTVHFLLTVLLLVYIVHLIALLQSVPTLQRVNDCPQRDSMFPPPTARKAFSSATDSAASPSDHRPSHPKSETAAICAIVKDEQLYLTEWTLYHLGLGFSHIYLYDNSPTLTTQSWRNQTLHRHPQIRNGTTVLPFPDASDTRQYRAYRHCMSHHGRHHAWVAILDVDEFLVLQRDDDDVGDVVSFARKYCPRGSLAIHWLVLGTSGETRYRAAPVTRRFQRLVPREHRDSFKSLIRVEDYKNVTYNHHWVELKDDSFRRDTDGKWVELRRLWSDRSKFSSKRKGNVRDFPVDVAAIYHYKYKSVEEYRWKMCERGDVLNLDLCGEGGKGLVDGKLPVGDGSKRYGRAYELLLRNVPSYRDEELEEQDDVGMVDAMTAMQQQPLEQQQQQQQAQTQHQQLQTHEQHLQQHPQPQQLAQLPNPSANSNHASNADPSTIFVISMQGTPGVDTRNEGRFDEFQSKWNASCNTSNNHTATPITHTNIVHCPGVYEPRRGYGLTLSWLLCLERAKDYDLDVTVIFEDDARLFDRSVNSFCDWKVRREEYWQHLPKDAFLAFLGGHNWEYPSKTIENDVETKYKELKLSFGTYAFAVPRDSLQSLLDTIKEDIVGGFRDENGKHLHHNFLSPERSWYRAAERKGKKIYGVNPLVIWHEGGFSNTWKKDRGSITGEEKDMLVNKIRGVDSESKRK